jgi:type I restriction enzyme S subunit
MTRKKVRITDSRDYTDDTDNAAPSPSSSVKSVHPCQSVIQTTYKHTEVGLIPEEWEVRPLLTAVQPATGQVDPLREPYRSMILVAPDHIESGTGRLLERRTAAAQGAISGKYLFHSGDIVYSKIRPYLQKAILADFDGMCSADMYPLTPAKDVCSAYIFAVLLSYDFTSFAVSVSARSGIPKINREELAEYVLGLPSLPEQRAIAAALSDMDALIAALTRLIAKKRDLKQAAMQQLLTGRTRLPGFSGEWPRVRIRDLLSYERPDRYIVRDTEYSKRGDVPVLTANKSFILGYTMEDFGICSHLPVIVFDDFTTDSKYVTFPFKVKSSAIKLLRPKHDEVDLRFVFGRMQLIQFSLGDHKRYYISEYQNLELTVPDPAEQTAIAAVLSDMDAEIAALEQRLAKTRALKQGMMRELLTGRTRLV